MPLHDWSDDRGWYGVQKIWLFEMLKWVFPLLPAEYRVYLRVVHEEEEDIDFALQIEAADERLIASINVILPRDKGRPAARERCSVRYLGYLRSGVHLMVIDALPRPEGFSFANEVDVGLDLRQPPTPAPFAISYRADENTATVSSWSLAVGQALPTVPIHLDGDREVSIDLEYTYHEAARRAYLT